MTAKYLLCVLTLALVACGPAKQMPEIKSTQVERLISSDVVDYFKLPLFGSKSYKNTRLWSGDYWPNNKGSINLRWNSPNQEGFDLVSPGLEQLRVMTKEEIALLSPAEKFDLYLGRYDYPLKSEVASYALPTALDSEGLCNGWAAATMNHNEPGAKEMLNPDGITIPFGSSDVKAILSYYYGKVHKEEITTKLGKTCEPNSNCESGLDAGAFHVMLANRLGLGETSFFIDVERFNEVWNHPVVGYQSTNLGDEKKFPKDVAKGTARIIKLKTKVTYVDRVRANSNDFILLNKEAQNHSEIEYRYNVYLNMKDEVIGGKWISTERPEHVWTMKGTKAFKGYFAGMNALLND